MNPRQGIETLRVAKDGADDNVTRRKTVNPRQGIETRVVRDVVRLVDREVGRQ